MNSNEIYMKRCIELAENGLGNVAPNPMVGAVLVHEGKIIGEGFHREFGKAHAEVNAIDAAISKYGEDILSRSTLFVNLEPCSHFGKTPPCADLIIQKRIPKVVIGSIDPSSKVNGEGITRMRQAGIEVTEPLLEKECVELNKRFFTFHKIGRPYIILKYAQSKDGFIAPGKITNENIRISNEYSHQLIHKWRSEEQAIMIGTNTARIDNPSLTVREWKGKNPARVVIDRELKLEKSLRIFDQSVPTLLFNNLIDKSDVNLEFLKIDFSEDVLQQILDSLHSKNIQSVLVEGGAKLLQSFINENLWDEGRIFTGNKILQNGIKAPVISGEIVSEENVHDDQLVVLRN